jgi:hypothetical protein
LKGTIEDDVEEEERRIPMSSAAAVIVGTIATDDDEDDDNTANDGRLRRLDDWLVWTSAAYSLGHAPCVMRRLAPSSFIVGSLFEH